MANQRSPLFKISVDKILGTWPALQISIANGQGGAYGKDIAIWMRSVVEDFFYENDNLDADEVAEFIGTIMNQELDTIVDDNSLNVIGEQLCQHFGLVVENNELGVLELHKCLDDLAAKPKPESHKIADSSDEESDEEMEIENTNGQAQEPTPHLLRVGNNTVTEPDEDGWSTVVKSKKH